MTQEVGPATLTCVLLPTLVTWLHLAVREAGKCSFPAWDIATQLSIYKEERGAWYFVGN